MGYVGTNNIGNRGRVEQKEEEGKKQTNKPGVKKEESPRRHSFSGPVTPPDFNSTGLGGNVYSGVELNLTKEKDLEREVNKNKKR